jgi:hypothetical protein
MKESQNGSEESLPRLEESLPRLEESLKSGVSLGRYMNAHALGLDQKRDVVTISSRNNNVLGVFEYHPEWRQYVFCADDSAIFSHDCISELADFCQKLNRIFV